MDVIQFFTLVVRSIFRNAVQELEQSGFAWGALLFAALEQWQSWAIGGVLLLPFGLCWWLRKRSRQAASSSMEAATEEEVNSRVAVYAGRISVKRFLPESFMMVHQMVDELLYMCRTLSRNRFMPQLQAAVRLRSALECWCLCEDDAVYNLLVPLKPPRGHSFHLQLSTTGEMPARNSRLRVELQCTCRRERLVEDMLCFLHHPEEELRRRNQSPSLLDTLCTGPYLDIEKTTRWFQTLVEEAWQRLPQSRRYDLTVLPSRRSCKLQLTNASNSALLIVITFVVQQDGLDTLLSIE